jgi:sucrose-6-phosphate hydrolase SacC (GH32 family)
LNAKSISHFIPPRSKRMLQPMTRHFHAWPAAGHWINDPNGLVFADGSYRLFVQHRADAPDFNVTNWGRFSSSDLVDWHWDGPVLTADDRGFAYSGSIVVADGLVAYHSRHREADPRQRQFRAHSADAGASWLTDAEPLGPAGDDVRDPFVWRGDGVWHMLAALPCRWQAADTASQLGYWTSPDGVHWTEAARIGPWHPIGIVWEVPVVVAFGDRCALIVSTIDRRAGATDCCVHYWLGRFDASGFKPDADQPAAGRRLDLGPDFYAAIANTPANWPSGDRVMIGWATSWATARRNVLSGGGAGGPISLPRRLGIDANRLHLAPLADALPHATRLDWHGRRATLSVSTATTRLVLQLAAGRVRIERAASDPAFDWQAERIDDRLIAGPVYVFIDHQLVEIFLGGIAITCLVPGMHPVLAWLPAP